METDLQYADDIFMRPARERDTLSPRDRARVEELKRNQALRQRREVNETLARYGRPGRRHWRRYLSAAQMAK